MVQAAGCGGGSEGSWSIYIASGCGGRGETGPALQKCIQMTAPSASLKQHASVRACLIEWDCNK